MTMVDITTSEIGSQRDTVKDSDIAAGKAAKGRSLLEQSAARIQSRRKFMQGILFTLFRIAAAINGIALFVIVFSSSKMESGPSPGPFSQKPLWTQ